MKTYFFDTYAILEMLKGSEAYKNYSFKTGFVTTKLNLLEFHHRALSIYGEEFADKVFRKLLIHTVDVSDEVLISASKFKHSHKKRKLSFVDCIGYVISQRQRILFLTGDKEFEKMSGVEFVK